MSKELEALERLYCSGNLQLDYVLSNKHQQDYESIEKALLRLEAIDNSNPSEALEYLEQFLNEMTYCLEYPKEYAKGYERQIFWKFKNTLETTIKQALLKAQEPKHYLKWEELEFEHTPKIIDVKMNGNKYKLVVGYNVCGDNLVLLRNDKQEYPFLERDKQVFNDLRLERVEE